MRKVKEFIEFKILLSIEKVFHRIHHFFCKIQRVLRYLPVIWKDEDWDFTYFLNVILVKLRQMEEYEKKYSIAMGTQVNVANIHKVSDTINKYLNFDEVWDAQNNYVSIENKLGLKRKTEEDKETGFLTITYVYRDTEEPIKEEDEKKIRDFYMQYAKEEEKTWKQIWSLISKHSRQWGD